MKRLRQILSALVGLGVLASCASIIPNLTEAVPTPRLSAVKPIRYEQKEMPGAIAHIVIVPAGHAYRVRPAVVGGVQAVDQFVGKNTIAIVNAGFFDPANQLTTSFITLDGKLVADPKANARMVDNPKLKAYLPQIFNRSEFRRYRCGDRETYGFATHQQATPAGCEMLDAIGAGPMLLPSNTAETEAFTDRQTGRDVIGVNQPNARSAIGLTAQQDVILIMVAQTQVGGGMTLSQMADLLKALGAESAMNLDGGTSSALYYDKQLIYGKRNARGIAEGRSVKSAIIVDYDVVGD
jgi:hypothetical protein